MPPANRNPPGLTNAIKPRVFTRKVTGRSRTMIVRKTMPSRTLTESPEWLISTSPTDQLSFALERCAWGASSEEIGESSIKSGIADCRRAARCLGA